MNATHTFTHEIQWHWVAGGVVLLAVLWQLSDSALAEDAPKEDAASVVSPLMTN